MIEMRAVGIGVLGLLLSTHALQSQDRSRYRDFQLGGDLASIAALIGMSASEATTIHRRPAMMQELQWQQPVLREQYNVGTRGRRETDCLQLL